MTLKRALAGGFSAILSVLFLGGCNITDLGGESMLRPPMAMGSEAAIEQLIADSTHNKYILKYPKNGNNRSAITMADLNADKKNEAIAFCRENDETTKIHMLIMYEGDGQWQLANDYTIEASDVDSVDFADINADNNLEILVGFSTFTPNVSKLSCYSYSDGTTSEITSGELYSSFYCGDFNSDGDDEVITLLLFNTENEAAASMIDYDSEKNTLYSKATVAMDPNVVRYRNVVVTKFGNVNALVVDGAFADEQLNTQIIYYNTEMSLLRNPLFKEKKQSFTQRSLNIISTDIDNDSEIEIPAASKMPAPKDTPGENLTDRVDWYSFDEENESTQIKLSMIVDYDLDFSFTLPEIWQDNAVTALYGEDKNIIEFYEWSKNSLGQKLFEIKAFEVADWDIGKGIDDYVLISKNEKYAFAFKKENADNKYNLGDDDIKTAFSALADSAV
ncbi:MAG TPA: hypothetical protein DD413_00645 [Ruminococcus sp.]|nr:hypothetical protein [Ruminococcus sp.]